MKKLIKSLKLMKKKGISAVKQSLEDEGATFRDIVIMREITKAAKVDLNIKIGGCVAKNDIFTIEFKNHNFQMDWCIQRRYYRNRFLFSFHL